jgi:hypothetical protein
MKDLFWLTVSEVLVPGWLTLLLFWAQGEAEHHSKGVRGRAEPLTLW